MAKPIFDLSGTGTLVGGILTITDTRAKLISNIMVCRVGFGAGAGGDLVANKANGSFTVSSRNRADNTLVTTDTSAFVYFILNPAAVAPPTVTITAPVTGAAISSATNPFTATATATSPATVRGVKFYVDNVQIGVEDTASPYSVNIDATTLSSGTHILKAVSYDTAGTASADATLMVTAGTATDTDPPSVAITAPAAGATLTGANNPFTVTATDNVGIRGVKFFIDNVLIGTEDTTSPYGVNIDSTTFSAGTHTLKAVAYDTAGTASPEAFRSITVGSAATAIWQGGIIYDIDADLVTGVVSGGLVTTIPSRVNGTMYSATQTTNTAYRGTLLTNRINGHAAIELLKVYDGYTVPALPAGLTALTIAFVARQPSFDITKTRRIISDTGLNFLMSIRGTLECYFQNSARSTVSSGHNLPIDTPLLMICEIDSTGVRYYNGSTLLNSVTVANPPIPQRPQIGLSPYGERTDAEITRYITVNKIWTAAEKSAFIDDMNVRYALGGGTGGGGGANTLTFEISEASPLPNGTINTAYTRSIATVRGAGSHTATSITAGALPAGLTANISAGAAQISGTPTVSGTFNFTVSITDSDNATATKTFAMSIVTETFLNTSSSITVNADGSLEVDESGNLKIS